MLWLGTDPEARVQRPSRLQECDGLASRIDQNSKAFFVSVQGTLRLEKDNKINSLYTLEDVAIKFLKMADLTPPNVLNACLNKPIQSHTNTGSALNDTTSPSPSQPHFTPKTHNCTIKDFVTALPMAPGQKRLCVAIDFHEQRT